MSTKKGIYLSTRISERKTKFLVVRFAPGSGGKFLSSLFQCSPSVHAWDDALIQAKQENNHQSVFDYIAAKFTSNFQCWQKNEPEVPYQTDFVSNRFDRGDNISFAEATELLSNDSKYQYDYAHAGLIVLILNKSRIPDWIREQAVIVNILIDTPESRKWFYRARFAKQFIKRGDSYVVKQEHEDYCSEKRAPLAAKYDNEKIFRGSWHSFAKKYLVGDKLGLQFQHIGKILEHPSNENVPNLFFNLSGYLDNNNFLQQFQKLSDLLGITPVSDHLLHQLIRHYRSIHDATTQRIIAAGLSYAYADKMWLTKKIVNRRYVHPNYFGEIGDQIAKEHLDSWCRDSGSMVMITDNKIMVQTKPHQMVFNIAPEFYGIHYMPFDLKSLSKPERAYNCLINRICPTRQSWFYKLFDIGLDKGFVSFNIDYREQACDTYHDKLKIFDQLHFSFNTLFQRQYEQTRPIVPYCNFTQTSCTEQVIGASVISLVIETYFDDNRAIALSEKTFRALQLPRPFVLFAPKGTIRYLRELGFQIIEDIVNHNYDEQDNWIVRQSMILDQLNFFVKNPQYDIPQKWVDIAYHNQSLMRKWNLVWDIKIEPALTAAAQTLYHQ